jgi:hypothetical protein
LLLLEGAIGGLRGSHAVQASDPLDGLHGNLAVRERSLPAPSPSQIKPSKLLDYVDSECAFRAKPYGHRPRHHPRRTLAVSSAACRRSTRAATTCLPCCPCSTRRGAPDATPSSPAPSGAQAGDARHAFEDGHRGLARHGGSPHSVSETVSDVSHESGQKCLVFQYFSSLRFIRVDGVGR